MKIIIKQSNKMYKSKKFILSMSLLLAGTALGAGILGLPIEAGLTGFFPSFLALLFCWLTLMSTGWIFIYKINTSRYPINDFADLYKKELGQWSICLNSIGYFITFYGVLTAYLCGISTTLVKIFPILISIPYAEKILIIIFFITLTSIVLFGVKIFKKINSLCAFCLLLVFLAMVLFSIFHVKVSNLKHVDINALPFTLPILFTTFCFHPVIPLICKHINDEKQSKRILIWILFWGTLIIFIVVFTWCFIILGIIPANSTETISIMQAHKENLPATVPLAQSVKSDIIPYLALLFTFFAIITSYIGAGAGFMNYVSNLSSQYIKRSRITDILITFLIPFLTALFYPDIFLKMLNLVGGVGVIIIYGFLPALLAMKKKNKFSFKILGVFIFLISTTVFLIEMVQCFN